MAITADLKKDTSRLFKGGGFIWIAEYAAAKTLLTPYCTLEFDCAIGATSLDSYGALQADFGAGAGALDVDIFGASPDLNKTYSGLADATGIFTMTTPFVASAHSKWATMRKYIATTAYATTDFKCLGHLAEEGSAFGDKTESEDVYNEELDNIKTLFGKRTVTLNPKLLQAGREELTFLLTECREKEYAMLYAVKLSSPLGKGRQYWAFPRVCIVPDLELTMGAELRKISVQIKVLKDDVSGEYYKLYQG
jgi:hypothetical protein